MFRIALISALSVSSLVAQRSALPSDTLATIDRSVVTVRDLLERLELMPFPEREIAADAESVKHRALAALIAEKILALEYDRRGIQEQSETRRLRRGLEQVLLRDELYRREVVAKVAATRVEIEEGMRRFAWTLNATGIAARSESDARRVRALFADQRDVDSLLNTVRTSPGMMTRDFDVNFGDLRPDVERMAYAAGAPGVTGPIQDDQGVWSILVVRSKVSNGGFSEKNVQERTRHVERIVRRRKEVDLSNDLYRDILSSRTARADSAAFQLIGQAVLDVLRDDSTAVYAKGLYTLLPEYIDRVLSRLEPDMEKTLIFFADGTLTIGDMAEMLRYEQFSTPTLGHERFFLVFNETVKALTANEFLAQEARARGLHNTRSFRRDIGIWSDYWKAHRLIAALRDTLTLSPNDIANHLVRHATSLGDAYQVNVREVLCTSMIDASEILKQLRDGADLGDLALRRSARPEWAARKGESGLMRLDTHPMIGSRALLANKGDLVGPLTLPEGISIFEVLEIRRNDDRFPVGDSLASSVRSVVEGEKREEALSAFISKAAIERGVTIDRKKLAGMRLTSINMFTRRYLGFGGTMTAVPMLFHQWNWVERMNEAATFLP